MDFNTCLQACKSSRAQVSRLFAGVPRSFRFTTDGSKVLFLAPPAAGGASSLFGVSLGEGESREWKEVSSHGGPRQLSRSEQLLRERMRATGSGIDSYECVQGSNQVFVVDGASCSIIDCATGETTIRFPEKNGAVDHKLCPAHSSLAACVVDGDVWVLDAQSGLTHQLTHTAADRKQTCLTAGQPSFIVQEEFDRYTGYWWQPKVTSDGSGTTYRILYEEVNECEVEELHTFNPSTQSVEDYRYPRPGHSNAHSTLKLLEFTIDSKGDIRSCQKTLSWKLTDCFPEAEYLVRANWLPDGDSVWVELVDRRQSHLWLVAIPLSDFSSGSVENSGPAPPSPCLLWEETSEYWINVADILLFLESPSGVLRFVVTSEMSGYRHLYLVQATLPPADCDSSSRVSMATTTIQELTTGEWVVFYDSVWVCKERELIFFEANFGSCLEKHLFCVSLKGELPCSTPLQLTPSGYHHTVAMDKQCQLFISVQSNESTPSHVVVYRCSGNPPTPSPLCTLREAQVLPSTYSPPTYFTVPSDSGEELHGLVYPPVGRVEGKTYPTVLFVYGGPHLQCVTQGFNRWLPRLHCWLALGFAVVMVDNRGSANRGVRFEAHLKEFMGRVEVEDQVKGLKKAAEISGFIDLSRVAITGWSYGGYMALMSLAQRPDVFKLAIAGAPVTDWKHYDTAYTERYLGVPPATQQAYVDSSVLKYTVKFPPEPNRLLILHGLNDENVLFTHTSLLVDRLVAVGRPYQLQVYTGERHGLRSAASASHCDATMLSFLLQHL